MMVGTELSPVVLGTAGRKTCVTAPPVVAVPISRPMRSQVLSLAWPAIVEMTLGMAVGVVGAALVGRLGAVALAAVGLGAQVMFIALTLFSAVNTGTTALVARYVGAGQAEEAALVARQALCLGGTVAVAACRLGIPLHSAALWGGRASDFSRHLHLRAHRCGSSSVPVRHDRY